MTTHANPHKSSGIDRREGQQPGRPAVRAALRAVGVATLAALIVNVVVWAGLTARGAELVVTRGGSAMQIGALPVVASTVLPMLVGGGLLALLAHRTPRAWPVLAWLGVALAVATLPMSLLADATTGTRVGLAAMHLVAGAVWWTALTQIGTSRAAAGRW